MPSRCSTAHLVGPAATSRSRGHASGSTRRTRRCGRKPPTRHGSPSSSTIFAPGHPLAREQRGPQPGVAAADDDEIGRASCREAPGGRGRRLSGRSSGQKARVPGRAEAVRHDGCRWPLSLEDGRAHGYHFLGCGWDETGQASGAAYTRSPSTKVWSTRVAPISSREPANGSRSSTTRSAYLPTSIVPVSSSRWFTQAEPAV